MKESLAACLLVLLAGCNGLSGATDEAETSVGAQTTATAAAREPGFPALGIATPTYDTRANVAEVHILHETGPCLALDNYRWEFAKSERFEEAEGYTVEGGKATTTRMSRLCIHDTVALRAKIYQPSELRVYNLTTGELILNHQFPPWPPRLAFNKDSADRTLTVVLGSNVTWGELSVQGCPTLNDGPLVNAGAKAVEVGDRLGCSPGRVVIAHPASSTTVYDTVFN